MKLKKKVINNFYKFQIINRKVNKQEKKTILIMKILNNFKKKSKKKIKMNKLLSKRKSKIIFNE